MMTAGAGRMAVRSLPLPGRAVGLRGRARQAEHRGVKPPGHLGVTLRAFRSPQGIPRPGAEQDAALMSSSTCGDEGPPALYTDARGSTCCTGQ